MRKTRIFLALLLAVGFLVLGAMLPGMVTDMLDQSRYKTPVTAPMEAVELELRDGQTMDVLERLVLHSRMQNVLIEPDDASMTEQEVYITVDALLQEYEKAGLIQRFAPDFSWAEPHLAIDPKDTSRYGIFWVVSYSTGKNPYKSMLVHLDDATGKILAIQCSGNAQTFEGPQEQMQEAVYTFRDLYMTQLGLEQSQLEEFLVSRDEGVWDKRGYGCGYALDIPELGIVNMEFYVDSGSCALQFPFR